MANEFYTPSGSPATSSHGASSTIRAEFLALQAAFNKMPTLSTNASKILAVNAGGNAIEALSNASVLSSIGAQPSSVNLTTYSSITPTTTGASLITAASGSAALTVVGGQPLNANLTSLAATGGQPLNANLTDLATVTPTATGKQIIGIASYAALKTAGAMAASGANADITSLTGLTTALSVTQGGTGSTTATAARTALSAAKSNAIAIFEEQLPNGTSVAAVAGLQTRGLNTLVVNEIGLTVASSTFTLLPGTYILTASAPAYAVNSHKIAILNVTDFTTDFLGTNASANAANLVHSDSFIHGVKFTIASSKQYSLQHYVQTAKATDGLGKAVVGGTYTEVYARVMIEKLD
jgi:hypothetical protein